ncbi:MAG: hypothetical protein K9K33_06420, partial [Desulfarculaceae bacterium]|nr:hypothetical protein [Desulfarculaceae bacterium]
MPKVLSSPKLPPNRGSGRRNFRLSPLEIGVAILVAMGGIYLLYVLLSGLWGGGEAPTPGPGSLAGINPARLDKVLSAAEVAQRRLSELDKRLVELDKRLAQASSGAPAEAGKGDPRLAARLSALEKQVAALAKAPGGKGGKADPKLAAKIQGLEAGFKELDQEKEQLAAQVQKMAKSKADPKLAAKVQGLEKQVAALAKAKPAAPDAKAQKRLAGLEKQVAALAKAKPSAPDAKTQNRLSELEKQVPTLAQRPAAEGEGGAAVNPQLVQRVVG